MIFAIYLVRRLVGKFILVVSALHREETLRFDLFTRYCPVCSSRVSLVIASTQVYDF